jgi:signal transduction histidine kinase
MTTQPSGQAGQAGQEVGFTVNDNGKVVPPLSIEPPRTHRRNTGQHSKSLKSGKDRHKQSLQSPNPDPNPNPKHIREIITMVSHDLRTPLTSIHGMLSLLSVGACGQLPPKALEAIQVAERGSTRLIALINDLLDIEMLESGQMNMDLKNGSTSALIKRSVEAVAGFASLHNIEIKVPEPEPKNDYQLYADEDRLVQVLVNLLSNAVKFAPNGSSITISVVNKGRAVEFRVSDQGPGIPSAHQGSLFQRFRKLEDITSNKLAGSGLGLAICKAIIEAHHGHIGIESNAGDGSTFWFRLPKECK